MMAQYMAESLDIYKLSDDLYFKEKNRKIYSIIY